jgi:hypothetical protein
MTSQFGSILCGRDTRKIGVAVQIEIDESAILVACAHFLVPLAKSYTSLQLYCVTVLTFERNFPCG